VLIDLPQPRDALTVGQTQLLHCVDLPSVVSSVGPIRLRRRPPPGNRRWLLQPPKPPMQGSLAWDLGRIRVLGEADADITSPPGRMLLPQRQRGGIERVLVRAPWARLVGGSEAFGILAKALQEIPNRPGAESEVAGDVLGCLTVKRPPLDGSANGERERRRHGNPRLGNSGLSIAYSSAPARQNLCCGNNGTTTWRATGA
jgi:hypothetical protein